MELLGPMLCAPPEEAISGLESEHSFAKHDQLPPLLAIFKFATPHLISLNRHQLYVLIVANGCGYTQGPFWLPWRFALVIKLKTTLPLLPLNYAFVVAAKTRIQLCLCNCR